ncbi:MAG: SrfA family protein, partial [Oceanisphaera sp.]
MPLMTGALLRSGRISSFKALGKTGQPVHRAALQLRNAIKRKDKRYALCLAIPQTDQQGDNIDWYSPVAGDVISWGAATETERAVARSRLEAVKAYLTTMREELLASEAKKTEDKSKDKQVFAELLEYVIHFPGEDFVYLVRSEEGDEQFEHNGRLDTSSNVIPVLTFWGFLHSDDMLSSDPLYCLYPPKPIEPPVAAPVVTPAVAPVVTPKVTPAAPSSTPAPEIITPTRMPWWKNWRRWLRWLLLLLLLLLLLFFLRACIPGAASVVPSFNLPGSKPTMPKVSRAKDSLSSGEMSGMNMPSVNMPDMNMPSVNMPDMNMPSMNMPDMNMPSVNMPDMDMP